MEKIKVLEVVGSLRMGGLETVAMNFFRYADKNKYEFTFLTYQKEKEYFEDEVRGMGGKIIKIDPPKKGIVNFIKNVKKIIGKDNYKIVHSHTFYNSGIIMYIAYKYKIPVRISHIHNDHSMKKISLNKKIYNYMMSFFIKKYSTKICACSQKAGISVCGDEFFEKYGIIINNCIDIDKYKFNMTNREKIRKSLSIKNDEIVIGNIGRLEKAKNQKFLIDIVKDIQNEKIKLVIGGEGTLRKELEDLTSKYKIIDKVIFLGNISNVEEVLSAFDIFALPSEHEGFGIVLLEAQANGLKCLASKYRVPESVKILESFEFIELEDKKKWIKEILNKEEMKRDKNAVEILRESKYDIKDFTDYIKELYV